MSIEPLVIFIDDDDDLRRATAQMLELSGFRARVFSSAKQALSDITGSFPGVIATDIRMPDMNGLQLFGRVRAIDPELPVILTTGHGDIDLAVAAMKDGAYDFITKPFIPRRLTDALRRGIEPGSAEGARVLEAILAGTAGSRQRGTLLAQLEAGTDPRVERYWQLTAVITGREPFSSQAPLKWLAAALRAQHEQGR